MINLVTRYLNVKKLGLLGGLLGVIYYFAQSSNTNYLQVNNEIVEYWLPFYYNNFINKRFKYSMR